MKIVKTFAALVIVLSIVACGNPNIPGSQQSQSDRDKQEKTYPDFPLSGKVGKIVKGTTVQVQLEMESKQVTVEVSPTAKVFFNSQATTINALAQGQTIYIESDNSKVASKIVITNWPDIDTVGKTVEISTEMVIERIIDFIRSNHPQLGLPESKLWIVETKESPFGDSEILKILKWESFKLRLIWIKDQTEPEYDAMLTFAGKQTAVWSGRFRKDGKVLEERYEKP
ncbi:MAG: hypothetical protein HGA95_03915 [Caldiserica bacterium]|nr:hypothetical protein [Caldisericota bacterium]